MCGFYPIFKRALFYALTACFLLFKKLQKHHYTGESMPNFFLLSGTLALTLKPPLPLYISHATSPPFSVYEVYMWCAGWIYFLYRQAYDFSQYYYCKVKAGFEFLCPSVALPEQKQSIWLY